MLSIKPFKTLLVQYLMEIKRYIEEYISDMQYAWSPSTMRSERHRLNGVAAVLDGKPQSLWDRIQNLKPYTRTTVWTRVCRFWDWLLDKEYINGSNEYTSFRKRNRRFFKGSYRRVPSRFHFSEIDSRIQRILCPDSKAKANWILHNALRVSEFDTLKNGTVVGKGGHCRQIYNCGFSAPRKRVSYSKFWRELKKVGLKPHDLRKAALTRLVEKGANEFELCAIAGWSDLNTAASYIRVNETKLKKLMESA